MNFNVACGSMRLLSNIGRAGFLDGIGVSKSDFDRLIGDDQWMASDRNRMTNVLFSLINASVDAVGLPRFDLPAEYVAAGIAMFVSGVNVQVCCVYAESQKLQSSEDNGRGVVTSSCTARQLFALVSQLYSDVSRDSCRQVFEKKTGLALDKISSGASAKTK